MRIAGVSLPDNKRLEVALTAVYGIGRSRARRILVESGIDRDRRPKELGSEEENKIRNLIENYQTEGVLKRLTAENIRRLVEIKSYRGGRHAKKLPVRGQRTRTNSRTRRGNVRKTMGSGRKKVDKK